MLHTLISQRLPLIIAMLFVLVWSLFAHNYYGPTKPLSKLEVEHHVSNVREMFVKAGVPDADGNVNLGAILTQMRRFAENDDGKPIYMINLMKWRNKAVFREQIQHADTLTAQDADLAYNQKLFYELAKNASHTAYLSSTFENAINYGFDDDTVDHWGEVGIFRYRSRRDFLNMLGSDSYTNIVYLKLASMGRIAITPSQPHGLLFNPMPNLPVLLAFLFIIAYLITLLTLRRSPR